MPVACLYKVTLGLRSAKDDPVMPTGACLSYTVVAKEAEAAVKKAREHLGPELRECQNCVVAVEFLEGIDIV